MTPTIKHIAYLRAYEKDGHARIWLEGKRVADAGFAAGRHFAIDYDDGAKTITLRLTDGMGKKIHSKKRGGGDWPIIDLFNSTVDKVFGRGARFRAEFAAGRITLGLSAISAKALARAESLFKTASSTLSIGSLFHGLGVLDLAIHDGLKAGGLDATHAFTIEKDQVSLDASLSRNPIWSNDSLAILGDVQDVDTRDLPNIDLLVAGIPCSGASMLGRAALHLSAAEFHPEVGHLFMPFLNVVRQTNPGLIVIENVVAYRHTIGFEMIRRDLTALGYEMEETVLNGCDFGALENRDRLILVARPAGTPAILPHLAKTPGDRRLADILDAVSDDDPMWKDYAHVHRKLARDAEKPRNGFKLNILDPSAKQVPTIVKGYSSTKSWQPFLRHPSGDGRMRKFSAKEHCAIKSIPNFLMEALPETTAHELLGQSVIYPVFKAVGVAIADMIKTLGLPAKNETPDMGDLLSRAA